MHASVNLKPVKQAKQLYSFDTIRVHNQNAFWGFGVIITTQAEFLEN